MESRHATLPPQSSLDLLLFRSKRYPRQGDNHKSQHLQHDHFGVQARPPPEIALRRSSPGSSPRHRAVAAAAPTTRPAPAAHVEEEGRVVGDAAVDALAEAPPHPLLVV